MPVLPAEFADLEPWADWALETEQERYAFFHPDVTKRQILAVEFNDDGKVADIRKYGIEDGQVIALVDRETPSRGKEMTLLQQLFGNMGGLPAGVPGAQNGPGRPGGSGE